MLPTEDAAWVAGELARRFGLPQWSFALTATDANRWAIRIARHVTGRPIAFVGVGEKTDALEPFHPDRLASRIRRSYRQPDAEPGNFGAVFG